MRYTRAGRIVITSSSFELNHMIELVMQTLPTLAFSFVHRYVSNSYLFCVCV